MPSPSATLPRCANCGVDIPWRPAVHRGKTYCCGGCVQGGPCYCSYDLTGVDPARRPVSHINNGAVRPAASRHTMEIAKRT